MSWIMHIVSDVSIILITTTHIIGTVGLTIHISVMGMLPCIIRITPMDGVMGIDGILRTVDGDGATHHTIVIIIVHTIMEVMVIHITIAIMAEVIMVIITQITTETQTNIHMEKEDRPVQMLQEMMVEEQQTEFQQAIRQEGIKVPLIQN